MKLKISLLLCLAGCSPQTLEDFHHEGQGLTKTLIEDLKPIQCREELEEALPLLRKRFEAFVDLMIEASEFQAKRPGEYFEELGFSYSLDDELLEEMKRIYELEKGRELIEKAQREPLLRLDSYKRKRFNDASV